MRYSPSNNGFYPEDIEYPATPKDLIVIADDLYVELLKGQSEGKVIKPNGEGDPYLAEQQEPSKEQYILMAESERSRLISSATISIAPLQYAVDLDDATEDDVVMLKRWKQYSVALNRLDLSTAPDITWPEIPA